MKNFIHIIPSLEAGGAETQLVCLALCEKRKGYNPIVVTLKKKNTVLLDRLIEENIDIHQYNLRGLKAGYELFLLFLFFLKLDSKKFTLVAWMYHAIFVSIFFKIFNPKLKCLWMIRRTAIPGGTTGLISKLSSFFSFLVPDKVICNSKSGLQSHAEAGYSPKKLSYLPNAIDVSDFEKIIIDSTLTRQDFGIEKDKTIIGVVGRYAPIKGHFELLKALSVIDDDFICMLIGRDIENALPLKRFFECDQDKNRLMVLGERPDIPALMQLFDFLVLPSLSEGFPNVVAEAMICGVPCIVTDVGDAAAIVGETGKVVTPGDSQVLAEAIQEWLNFPRDKLITLGEEAKERIVKNYDVNHIASMFRDFI